MEYNSIYGYIKIYQDYDQSVAFIRNLGMDSYPDINPNMFSFGDKGYHYENPIFGFAATYKNFGKLSDWNKFILRMEHILRNIDFENAQFHVESTIGNFTLFWASPHNPIYEKQEESFSRVRLLRTDEWSFGFGKRSAFDGYLEDKTFDEREDLRNTPIGFSYPVPKI